MAHKKMFSCHRNVERKCQRFVQGLDHGTMVRDHPRDDWVPVQHCHVWLWSALESACQPPTGESFPCSSTIMYKTHYHRKEEGGAQTRMSFHSLSSLLPKQTASANGRSTLKSDLLTPFLTQTYSHIPWGDPVCVLDEAILQKTSDYKTIASTTSTQREQAEAVDVALAGISYCSLHNAKVIPSHPFYAPSGIPSRFSFLLKGRGNTEVALSGTTGTPKSLL